MHLSALLALLSTSLAAPSVSPTPMLVSDLQTEGAFEAAQRMQVSIELVHDASAHGDFLDELAELRRTGQHEAFRARLELERQRQSARRAPIRARLAELGLSVVAERWLTETVVVEGSPQSLEQLESLPGVVGTHSQSHRAPASLKQALNANHHDAQGANLLMVGGSTIEGDGVVVAVIDTGIDADMNGTGIPHKAFYEDADSSIDSGGLGGSRVLSAHNAAQFTTGVDPEDYHGHGTRMAGILAGAKFNGFTPVADGVAPGAFIRSFRIDDDVAIGLASTFSMAQAFNDAAAMPDVRVANMSYDGTHEVTDKPNPEIDNAARAGLLITLSAGNDGSSGTFFHGAYNALPVGASDLQTMEPYNDPAFFVSAIGPLSDGRVYPKLIAVGEKLTSAIIDDESNFQNSYGSSGAAAIVAGSAALVFQADPLLSAREVRALLVNTALDVTLGNEDGRGFGYVHTKDVVEAALADLSLDVGASEGDVLEGKVTLAAGESFSATIAWDRVRTWLDEPADLDLSLESPDGLIVASSRHPFDTIERLQIDAPIAGDYTLRVEVHAIEDGESNVSFGLATSSALTPAGTTQLCQAAQQTAEVVQSDPVSLIDYPFFAIKGCGFSATTSVLVGGSPMPFAILSDSLLRVELPGNTPAGNLSVAVNLGATTLGGSVNVGVDMPTYQAHYVVGTIPSDELTFDIHGEPNEPYAVFYSFSQAPTNVPGVIDLLLGAGATDLYLLFGPGFLNSNGDDFQNLGLWPVPPSPIGLKIYSQAVVHSTTANDWIPSNLSSTVVVF